MHLCPRVKPQKKEDEDAFTHFPLLNTEKLTLWDPGGEKSYMFYGRSVEGSMKSASHQTLSWAWFSSFLHFPYKNKTVLTSAECGGELSWLSI